MESANRAPLNQPPATLITTRGAGLWDLLYCSRYSGFCLNERTNERIGFGTVSQVYPVRRLPKNTSTLPRIHGQARFVFPSRTRNPGCSSSLYGTPNQPRDSNDTPVDSSHSGFPSSSISLSVPVDGQLRAKKTNPLWDLDSRISMSS